MCTKVMGRRLSIASQTSGEGHGYIRTECELRSAFPLSFRSNQNIATGREKEKKHRKPERASTKNTCPCDMIVEIPLSQNITISASLAHNDKRNQVIKIHWFLPITFSCTNRKGVSDFFSPSVTCLISVLKVWESDFHSGIFQVLDCIASVWGRKWERLTGAWVRGRQRTAQVHETKDWILPHLGRLPAVYPQACPTTSLSLHFYSCKRGYNKNVFLCPLCKD